MERSEASRLAHAARRDADARRYAVTLALEALVQAAACLTEPSTEHLAQAFVLAGVAMVQIGHADEPEAPALNRAIEHLDAIKARKAEQQSADDARKVT